MNKLLKLLLLLLHGFGITLAMDFSELHYKPSSSSEFTSFPVQMQPTLKHSYDLASSTIQSLGSSPYDYEYGVGQSYDITRNAVAKDPASPVSESTYRRLEQIADPTYAYRIIDVNNPAATALLVDTEMQRLHRLYLHSDGGVQRIELEQSFLKKELASYFSYFDWRKSEKTRRLSFMRRLLEHYAQVKMNRVQVKPGQIQSNCLPGQKPQLFGFSKSPYDYDDTPAEPYIYFDDALTQLQEHCIGDFQSYYGAMYNFMRDMEKKGLVSAPEQSQYAVLQAGLVSFYEHIIPENPLHDPVGFFRDVCSVAAWSAFHTLMPTWSLEVTQAAMIADQVSALCAQNYITMKPKERAALFGKTMAEAIKGFIANKAIGTAAKVVSKKKSGIAKVVKQFTRTTVTPHEHGEAVTPEGITITVEQLPQELIQLQENVNGQRNLPNEVSTKTNLIVPQIGEKLKYVFGKATGSSHNIARSKAMAEQLSRIGIFDNAEGNAYLRNHLTQVLNDSSNIIEMQNDGRVIRESLLMGLNGGLAVHSTWEGDKLITVILFG